jgi:hypothetical protein
MKEKIKNESEVPKVWAAIDNALVYIYEHRNVELKYQDLFDAFYLLTISNYGHLIELLLKQSYERLTDLILPKLVGNHSNLLQQFNQEVAEYANVIDKVQKIGIYYDSRYSIPKLSKCTALVGYETLQGKLTNTNLFDCLAAELVKGIELKRQNRYHNFLELREASQNLVSSR